MILIVIAVVAGFVLGCLFRSESMDDGGNARPVVPHPRALGP
jgi:hypothetical protein